MSITHPRTRSAPRAKPATQASVPEAYAPSQATAALLSLGQAERLRRLDAPDMGSTDAAAERAGATRATIVSWIAKGRCIGLERAKRGFRLPLWQFEPAIFGAIEAIAAAMDTTDGWVLLSFLETPHGGLGGLTPRMALEQGMRDRVIALAGAH
jgi:predicted DNA-binding protein (UPF0251 family)